MKRLMHISAFLLAGVLIAPRVAWDQGAMTERIQVQPEDLDDPQRILLIEEGFTYMGPIIDVHTHIFLGHEWRILEAMDRYSIVKTVLLSSTLVEHGRVPTDGSTALLQSLHPDRFDFFVHYDPRTATEPGYGKREAERLRGNLRNGAKGVKLLWTPDLRPYPINDPRFEPIFEMLEQERALTMVHIGYTPGEMRRQLDLEGKPIPEDDQEIERLYREWNDREHPAFKEVVKKHPGITFIAAHWMQRGYDMPELDRMLSTYPNLYLDTSGAVGLKQHLWAHPEDLEKGRQFVIKWAGRLLFTADLKAGRGHYMNRFEGHRKFFEGKGKWVYTSRFGQEMWEHGLNLPPEVMRKIYYDNAVKLLGTDSKPADMEHFREQLLEEYEAWKGQEVIRGKGRIRRATSSWSKKAVQAQAIRFIEKHLKEVGALP